MSRFLHVSMVGASVALFLSGTLNAQSTAPAASQPAPEKLTLHPAIADTASLKYRLMIDGAEQTSGNAAPLYLIAEAIKAAPSRFAEPFDSATQLQLFNRYEELDGVDDKDFPFDEAKSIVEKYARRFEQIDLASHRSYAEWNTSERERGWAAWLSNLDSMRHLAILMELKIRVEIREAHWDAAARSLQESFAMGYHLNSHPGMIQALVANGLIQVPMHRAMKEWVSRPRSPNLYWSLSALPSPTTSLQSAANLEQVSLRATDPQFAAAVRGELPPEQWPAVIKKAVTLDNLYKGNGAPADVDALTQKLVKPAESHARKYFAEHGRAAADLNRMTAEHVVGMYFFEEFDEIFRKMFRGWELPTPGALDQINRSWQEITAEFPQWNENPLIHVTFFGNSDASNRMLNIRCHLANADEQLAVMRTIEAIRDYAARHNGQPPATLDQIIDVPIPLEPMTNLPVHYELKGKVMTLRAAKPYDSMWYELTMGQ